jgi:hypothetical protein
MGTKIYNSSLTKEIVDVAKIQTSMDSIPSEISEKVVLVADVNPKHARIVNIVKYGETSVSGTTDVYSIPSNKEFYLVGFNMSLIKDAACDNISLDLRGVINGETVRICQIVGLTLTADSKSLSQSFYFPIKFDKGTNISMVGTKAVGNFSKVSCIQGFTIDNINA